MMGIEFWRLPNVSIGIRNLRTELGRKERRTQQKARLYFQYSLPLDTHLRVTFRNHSFS